MFHPPRCFSLKINSRKLPLSGLQLASISSSRSKRQDNRASVIHKECNVTFNVDLPSVDGAKCCFCQPSSFVSAARRSGSNLIICLFSLFKQDLHLASGPSTRANPFWGSINCYQSCLTATGRCATAIRDAACHSVRPSVYVNGLDTRRACLNKTVRCKMKASHARYLNSERPRMWSLLLTLPRG